jgi:hypothetical protein
LAYVMTSKISDYLLLMKNFRWLAVVSIFCLALLGCEKGDPTALKEAVKAAELNVTSITVQPMDGTITTGYDVQFTATGYRPDGSTVDVTNSVTWSSSNTNIATVNSSGFASTEADGSVTISASLVSATGSTSLTASSEPLQSIEIVADTDTPNDLTVSACKNLQLKAIGTYADGVRDVIPITDYVIWSITTGEADISDRGLLRTFADGTIDVQADLDTVNGTTAVTADTDLTSIAVAPATQTLSINGTLQYTATGNYNDNSAADITNNVSWSSETATVANFNTPGSNGLITGLATGSTTVTAACGTTSGTANLTVSQDVVDNVIFEDENGSQLDPFNTVVGVTTQVYLMAQLSDGSSRNITEDAQWSIYNNTGDIVAVNNTTDNKGIITALAAGTGLVQATYQRRDYLLVVNVTQR